MRAKLSGVTSARLAVDTDPLFSGPTYFGPDLPTSDGMVTIDASGLDAGTTYLYAVEQDGVLNPGGMLVDGTSGDYASTPDTATLDIAGDLDVRFDGTADDWVSGAIQTLIAKYSTSGPDRAYWLNVDAAGTPRLIWDDGATLHVRTATVALADGPARRAIRATLDVDNGAAGHTVTFYTSDTISGSWTQLGAPVVTAGTTVIRNSAQPLEAGTRNTGTVQPFIGTIHAIEVRSGIGGTVVADPNFTAQDPGTTSFADSAGLTWTVQGAAEIVSHRGRFRTAPGAAGEAISYTFVTSGDAGLVPDFPDTTAAVLASDRQSNAPTFDTMREHAADPLFFLHLGDMHYYDLGSDDHGIVGGGTLANYRRGYDDVMLQQRQANLYRSLPTVYVWDDHDFGPNNSDGTLLTKANAAAAYRERVPSYGLPDTDAVYHSFEIGRVLYVVLDPRYYRSPNTDPDSASKTMLGSAQKTWLAGVLSSSSAAALVMVSPLRWINGSSDSWPGFATERQEIADLLDSTGWADRMVMVNGDVHALAFDSGANNQWGGFPVYVVGSIDATPFDPTPSSYDQGASIARDQYATFQIVDTGSQITITVQGYEAGTVQVDHSYVIDTEPAPGPGPEPEPSPTPIAQAQIRTRVTWLGCDLSSGRVIAELPDVVASVSRVLGAYTSGNATVPIPLAGPAALGDLALRATAPASTMLVAVVNDIPTYAGIVLPREGGTDATLELGLVSLEGYLDHRMVRAHEWTQQDEASVICVGLIADAEDIDGLGQGLGLVVDAPATGVLRDRTYLASDRKSVYEALQELMAVQDGPEWTIDIDWTDDTHVAISKIFRVRSRLGTASDPPVAVFDTTAHSVFSSAGSSEARYRYKEDLSGGLFANYVIAYSSGEGEDQPVSTPAVDTAQLASGVPIWEKHFQPSTSITDVAVLDEHAEAELARRRSGSRTYTIEARWDAPPRYGVDWVLGDDVAWQLKGHRHPAGITGQGRVIGFQLDMQRGVIKPILVEEV